jgi:hypothetical protein
MMATSKTAPQTAFDAFVQSIRDAREETREKGTVDPEEVQRSSDEAIDRGLLQRRGIVASDRPVGRQ